MEQETKSIIDRIWTNFWEGGVTNPLTVIEQITYLLFIKFVKNVDLCIKIFYNKYRKRSLQNNQKNI